MSVKFEARNQVCCFGGGECQSRHHACSSSRRQTSLRCSARRDVSRRSQTSQAPCHSVAAMTACRRWTACQAEKGEARERRGLSVRRGRQAAADAGGGRLVQKW